MIQIGIILGLVLWAVFGSPSKDVANAFWSDSAAPWESVDAFYYPDRNNLQSERSAFDFKSIEECRDWVYSEARYNNDARLARGDYECGVGHLEDFGTFRVYRLTTR